MRIPRRFILSPYSTFHKIWRAHNKERIFRKDNEKKAYLDELFRYKNKANRGGVKMFSFCIMSNHVHEIGEIGSSLEILSQWMRSSHSVFGSGYNKRHNRSGKVAEDRPKTVRIENDVSLLRVMFYCDCNPVRAGIVKHPKDYPWSSYRFYAFGEVNEWTKHLDVPQCYLNFGNTPEERQKVYRELCDTYLNEWMLAQNSEEEKPRQENEFKQKEHGITHKEPVITPSTVMFYGSTSWMRERYDELKSKMRKLRKQYKEQCVSKEKEEKLAIESKQDIACCHYNPG